jgi:hypothetical protein
MKISALFLTLTAATAACLGDYPTQPSFSAAATTVADPVLIGAGDIAGCSTNYKDEQTAKLVDSLLAANPGARVFTAGDNAMPSGLTADWACYQASWGRFNPITWFTLGNHEYNRDTTATPSFNYILGVGVDSGENGKRGKGFHIHDCAPGWRCYFFNSRGGKNIAEQTSLLKSDMASNPRACQLLVFHRPLHIGPVFSSGVLIDPATNLRPWHMAFWKGHGDLIVNGHIHAYRSTFNIRPDTTPGAPLQRAVADTGGYRTVIEGGGGDTQVTTIPPRQGYDRKWIATVGVVKLTLSPKSYKVEAFDTLGHVIDMFTRKCH